MHRERIPMVSWRLACRRLPKCCCDSLPVKSSRLPRPWNILTMSRTSSGNLSVKDLTGFVQSHHEPSSDPSKFYSFLWSIGEGFASSIGKCLRYRKLHLDERIFTSWIRAWNLGVSVSAWCPSSSGPHPEAGCHPLAATAAHGTESTGWACTTDLAQHWEKTDLFFLAAGGRRTYTFLFS